MLDRDGHGNRSHLSTIRTRHLNKNTKEACCPLHAGKMSHSQKNQDKKREIAGLLYTHAKTLNIQNSLPTTFFLLL